jgi:hypothetical protein
VNTYSIKILIFKNHDNEIESHKLCGPDCDRDKLGLIATVGGTESAESFPQAFPGIQNQVFKQLSVVQRFAGTADED